jgi:HEPN domain-containing protein/predicted nucleotidyltransferase
MQMTLPAAEIDLLHPALPRIIEGLRAYQPEQIILFGSRARGDAGEHSDIDLIVIKETGTPYRERFRESSEYLPEMLGVGVDVIVYTPEEVEGKIEARSPFLAAVFTDGVVVYDRNPIPGGRSLKSRLKEPTMESRLHNGQVWVDSARRDLRLSQLALTDEETAGGACFHAQQAAEKALKGFLIFCGLPLERNHSVQDLARRCVQQDEDFLACVADAQVLSSYYIDTRYAEEGNGFIFKTYNLPEAEQAVERAERVVALVQSKIQPLP